MTTIAVDPVRGEMSADTQFNTGGTKSYGQKLFRLRDGSLLGGAGVMVDIARVAEWLNGPRKGRRPDASKVNALWLWPDGALWSINEGWPAIRLANKPTAVGTGDQAAIAAMVCFGATTRDAIKAAKVVDAATGGCVRTLRLKSSTAP